MGPALGVSHILAFTLTPLAPSLRIVKLSDGPTLSFRIERYSLMKDVLSTTRRAKSIGLEYLSPPLVSLSTHPPSLLPANDSWKSARPGIISTPFTDDPSSLVFADENISIAISPTFTTNRQLIVCKESRPDLVQRRTRYDRLPPLYHQSKTLWCIETGSKSGWSNHALVHHRP